VVIKRNPFALGKYSVLATYEHRSALAILKGVNVRADAAQPEVSHGVRVDRRAALWMDLVKAEQPSAPIITEGSEAFRIGALRNHGFPPVGSAVQRASASFERVKLAAA
jgi:hypothetical protein